MEISEGVIRLDNTLLNLHNSSQDSQDHSLLVKLYDKTQSISKWHYSPPLWGKAV